LCCSSQRAVEERERVVSDLRQQLETEIDKRKEVIKSQPVAGEPTKLEHLQAEALVEKQDEIESMRIVVTEANQRVTKAEAVGRKATKEADSIVSDSLARAEAAEAEAATLKEESVAKNARLSALERHLSKRSDEVSKLREALGDFDPSMPDTIITLEKQLAEKKHELASKRGVLDEKAEVYGHLRESQAEVSQLQKQRRHLEGRIKEITSNNERLERQILQLKGKASRAEGVFGGENPVSDSEGDENSEDSDEEGGGIKRKAAQKSYPELLQEAYNTDLRAIEELKCIGITARDD